MSSDASEDEPDEAEVMAATTAQSPIPRAPGVRMTVVNKRPQIIYIYICIYIYIYLYIMPESLVNKIDKKIMALHIE